ncbi:AP-like endonuclease reverse transcriptase, partial [Brachionus plicatilis]
IQIESKTSKTVTSNFTRIYSDSNSTISRSNPNVHLENLAKSMLNLLIDTIKLFNQVTESIEENPQFFVNLVNKNLVMKTKTSSSIPTMMNNKLKILHLNAQSIVNESKKILLQNLIESTDPDVISINETFLKPKKPLNLLNYNVYRSDRLFRKGGGAAICIKKTLSGNPIDLSNILTHENGIGYELDLKNNKKLAIFSIFCSPCTRINPEIFDHIKNKHINSVIIGDLNAKNSMWHCKSTDPKGEVLENILSELNMHVLNSSKRTYNRGKSVLNLYICSNSIRKYFESHQVLDFKISDHQPTMTTFNNINSEPKRFKT